MVSISVTDSNDFVETVTLDDKVYKLHFAYNGNSKDWTIDIRDSNNVDIVRSIKIVPNFPLLAQYKRHDLSKGELIAVVNNNKQVITRKDFINNSAILIYIPKEELNELLETAV